MKINMTIKDRLVLPTIMPKQGNIMTMTIAEDITAKTKLTQAEFEDIGFQVLENSSYKWEKDVATDIEFTAAEIDLIKLQLKELDEKNEITPDTLAVYRKFHNVV